MSPLRNLRRVRPAHRSRALAGRLSWGLADQAVSSLTNFAVGVVVARELGVAGFGVFTLVWVTHGVLLNVSRGLATDPLVVRHSGPPGARWREASARAIGTALAVGVLAGALILVGGLVAGGAVGSAFAALGVVLPAMLVQDGWRFTFFAAGLGRKAFGNDLVWAAAMVPALAIAANERDVAGFVLAWGGAAVFAAACGWWQSGTVPRPRAARAWLTAHRDLGYRYLAENVANSGAAQLRTYGIGAIVGLAGVGALRGAELLLGPFLALLMGIGLVAVPEAARALRRGRPTLLRFCIALGAAQGIAAAVWGTALLLALPDPLGVALLDDVWHAASPLILPVTLSVAGAGVVAGATTGLRALGAARRSLRAQLVASAGYLGGGLAGAASAGATGAAWGSAIAMWCGAALWWRQLRTAARETPVEKTDDEERSPT